MGMCSPLFVDEVVEINSKRYEIDTFERNGKSGRAAGRRAGEQAGRRAGGQTYMTHFMCAGWKCRQPAEVQRVDATRAPRRKHRRLLHSLRRSVRLRTRHPPGSRQEGLCK